MRLSTSASVGNGIEIVVSPQKSIEVWVSDSVSAGFVRSASVSSSIENNEAKNESSGIELFFKSESEQVPVCVSPLPFQETLRRLCSS